MSTQTKNYGLIKPELKDAADITAMNANWDKIDEELLKSKEVFIAEVDVTSFEELNDAFKAGKLIFCRKGGFLLSPTYSEIDFAYYFSCNSGTAIHKAWIMDISNGWIYMQEPLHSGLYSYGTDDLTAGESSLETGKLYFVYE